MPRCAFIFPSQVFPAKSRSFNRSLDCSFSIGSAATSSTRASEAEYPFRRRLGRELGEKGWLFPTYPVEYGGAGLSAEHQAGIEAGCNREGRTGERG